MVHGLWNNPSIFRPLLKSLEIDESMVFTPHLPHDFGRVSLRCLAKELDSKIHCRFGSNPSIDILGFSMGGIISRIWIQELDGAKWTKRFISVASPHKGTLTAQLAPSFFFPGIADMKLGSKLISSLNYDSNLLKEIECISFYSLTDLMVFPGWTAVLPSGARRKMPVLSHKSLITHSTAVKMLADFLLNSTKT